MQIFHSRSLYFLYISEYKWIGNDQFHSLFIRYICKVYSCFNQLVPLDIQLLLFRNCLSSFLNCTISFRCLGLSRASTICLTASFTTGASPRVSATLAVPKIWDALTVSSAASLNTGAALWVPVILAVYTIWAPLGTVPSLYICHTYNPSCSHSSS